MSSSIHQPETSVHIPTKRKLVALRRITSLKPIKRSRWEVAIVGGWNIVVTKGEHSVGELVVYIEIDSFLPMSDERFWEYTGPHANHHYEGERGYVVRTLMRLGHISQGLIFPLNAFPEINVEKREELKGDLVGSPGRVEGAMMELDYSEMLGVKKFEPQYFEEEGAPSYGPPPIIFPQPGCERAQNVVNLFHHYSDIEFLITEKLDGVPITVYSVENRSQWYKALPRKQGSADSPRPRFGVCGRWTDHIEEEESLFWKTVRRQGIIEKIPQIGMQCTAAGRKKGGNNFAIQGEFCGETILGNSMGFEAGQHHFYAFAIYDIDNQKWLPPDRALSVCRKLNIDHAPIIARVKLNEFANNMEELLQKAEGRGILGNNREGLMFRTLDNAFAFKAIANNWLLEYSHYKTTPDQW
ncbi:RNA ligase-domain-containing protein [Truncatella angustata]|uniref:RNA ligase-domain-containing protein n=1 Tax=Truncatella angustata TaxID=152316 RepID=A0A9P8RPN6_9PEZI|nr:RNA ligase-domain-containing protein [Truncatella angustata]KAH6647387.1 RNA ligase-domain-containing protein [Truncatella angustata]